MISETLKQGFLARTLKTIVECVIRAPVKEGIDGRDKAGYNLSAPTVNATYRLDI